MSELGSKPRPAEPSPSGSSLSRAQAGIPGALHLFLIALIMARGCLAGAGQGKGIGGGGRCRKNSIRGVGTRMCLQSRMS